MKKVLIVAAAAGLISLAACTSPTTNTTVVNDAEANAAIYADTGNTVDNGVVENVAEPVDANVTATENAM